MKKLYFSMFTFVSAMGFSQSNVSFENFTISGSESYWDGSDYTGTNDGSGVLETYYDEADMEFYSAYDTSWGAIYGYWSQGWAFSNQTLDTMTGLNGLFSSYVGGASDGSQYAIGQQGSRISLTNTSAFFISLKVTNNNYAAHSMLNGDSFAKQFGGSTGDDPDWFLLSIVGYDTNDVALDTVEHYLADYRFTNNSQDYISKTWETISLGALSNAAYIEFNLSSSDNGSFGMNTPAFFAIDEVIQAWPISVEENEIEALVYPNPSDGIFTLKTDVPVNSKYFVSNTQGQILLSGAILSPFENLDIQNCASGIYFLTIQNEKSSKTILLQKN